MIGEHLDVLPITTHHLTITATPKQTGGVHKETGQLELSSELKHTVYSLFI